MNPTNSIVIARANERCLAVALAGTECFQKNVEAVCVCVPSLHNKLRHNSYGRTALGRSTTTSPVYVSVWEMRARDKKAPDIPTP